MKIISIDNFDSNLEKLSKRQRMVSEFLLTFFEKIENGYKECTVSLKDSSEFKLFFVPFSMSSYEMTIHVSDIVILIELNGWHEHFYYNKADSIESFLQELKNFLIFILSDACKLLIFKSNNRSYKWNLISINENRLISSTGLFLYNFFGKRSIQEKKTALFKDGNFNSAKIFFQKYV